MKSSLWKKALLLPGMDGGSVYWRVIGTRSDKTKIYSNTFSIKIKEPEPVANPEITLTSLNSLPILTWENRCNTNFKVWFGNNADFADPITKKKALSFRLINPSDNGGMLNKELTSSQRDSIGKLIEDEFSPILYWYVESWDVLKRYAQAEVLTFEIPREEPVECDTGPHLCYCLSDSSHFSIFWSNTSCENASCWSLIMEAQYCNARSITNLHNCLSKFLPTTIPTEPQDEFERKYSAIETKILACEDKYW